LAEFADDVGDAACAWLGVLVLPEAQDRPPSIREKAIRFDVACAVPRHLVQPVAVVRRGHRVVFRAAMPEASVKEDGHLDAGEDEISGAPNPRDRPYGYAVPQPARVNGLPECELWLGVAASVGLHAASHAFAGRAIWLLACHGVHVTP
jgi:hypothetical protein